MSNAAKGPVSRALKLIAAVEPPEVRAVLLSFVYFFFLMASYYVAYYAGVLKKARTMGAAEPAP